MNMIIGDTINLHKPRELNVESDIYAPPKGPYIP